MTCSPHCNRCREDYDPPTLLQSAAWIATKSIYRLILIAVMAVPIYMVASIPFPKATYINTLCCLLVVCLTGKLYDCLGGSDD